MNTYEVIVDVECWYVVQVEAKSEQDARRIVEEDDGSLLYDYEYGDHNFHSVMKV